MSLKITVDIRKIKKCHSVIAIFLLVTRFIIDVTCAQ
jgi:hypothetical protein